MSFQHNYFQYYFLKTSSILNSGYFWELPIAFPPTMSRKYRQLGEKFRMVCLFPSAWVVLVLVSTGNLLQESKRTPHDFLLQVRSVCMSQRPQGCCPHWVGCWDHARSITGWRGWGWLIHNIIKNSFSCMWHLSYSCSGVQENTNTEKCVFCSTAQSTLRHTFSLMSPLSHSLFLCLYGQTLD